MHEQSEFQPRKLPRQARSKATVDAIVEATMEILRKNEGGTSTTRIALRAGVSVGTLYQYFPHQNALRFAALQRHLESLTTALEALCTRHRGKALSILARDFATGWVQLKAERVPDRLALHCHMAELDMEQAKLAVFARTERALADLLLSAPDGCFADVGSTAAAMLSDMHTATWPALVHARDPAKLTRLRCEIAGVARHYLGRTDAGAGSIEMRIA